MHLVIAPGLSIFSAHNLLLHSSIAQRFSSAYLSGIASSSSSHACLRRLLLMSRAHASEFIPELRMFCRDDEGWVCSHSANRYRGFQFLINSDRRCRSAGIQYLMTIPY